MELVLLAALGLGGAAGGRGGGASIVKLSTASVESLRDEVGDAQVVQRGEMLAVPYDREPRWREVASEEGPWLVRLDEKGSLFAGGRP